MKTNLAQFSLERDAFQTEVVEKNETGILYSGIVPFMKYFEKHGRARRQATDDNMAHALCMLET